MYTAGRGGVIPQYCGMSRIKGKDTNLNRLATFFLYNFLKKFVKRGNFIGDNSPHYFVINSKVMVNHHITGARNFFSFNFRMS
jgi:hypothetical protein